MPGRSSPDSDISLRLLDQVDTSALQCLLERCADFSQLVEGEPPGEHAAQDLLADLPPGKSLADKSIFGIFLDNALVGVLDSVRGYPQDDVFWIGLLLLDPTQRGRGVGEKALNAFIVFSGKQGAQALMLGVVEENVRGFQFWQRMGFKLVERRPPRLFGRKEQVVLVLRKEF